MQLNRIIAAALIGVLIIIAACAKPVTPPPATLPPTILPPSTPPATPPVTPPAAPPATPPVIAVPGPDEVWVPGREFRPAVITVPVGTKVIWVSKDSEDHTVTSGTGLFNGTLSPYGSFSYTFTERGAFSYSCTPHPEMIGTVNVE